jgi:hypothetical protein
VGPLHDPADLVQGLGEGSRRRPSPRRALTSHRDAFQIRKGPARSVISPPMMHPASPQPPPAVAWMPSQSIVRPVASGGLSLSNAGCRTRIRLIRMGVRISLGGKGNRLPVSPLWPGSSRPTVRPRGTNRRTAPGSAPGAPLLPRPPWTLRRDGSGPGVRGPFASRQMPDPRARVARTKPWNASRMSDETRELPPKEERQPPYELDPPRAALVGCLSTVALILLALWAVVGRRR